MAESLRRLINIGSFSILQDKLEKWLDDYDINSCDQNVARCCEVIELNAKVQSQLFKLLCLTASEGGMYGGSNVIKSRLLPWLGQNFFTSGGSVTGGTSLSVLTDAAINQRKLEDMRGTYERSVQALEDDMNLTQVENDNLRSELSDTQDELFRLRIGSPTHYDREIQNLKDEMRFSRSLPLPILKSPYRPRSTAPLSLDNPIQHVRQNNVISRFNDMFAQDRLDAMDTLRLYSIDAENNQRILYTVMQEASTVARLAFRQFKSKVRSNIASCHLGPETLEEAVQDYINRNMDLYDLPGMVADVIRGLNRNLTIFLPPRASFNVIQPFIREACKLSWQMAALAYPIDFAIASDGELYDDIKYRRSYDSEYLAPLVNHHIWPTLMQGAKVLMKGEAVTKRGASLNSSIYRSRSRSPARTAALLARSRSPSAGVRSRSLSPRRACRSTSPFRSISPYPR